MSAQSQLATQNSHSALDMVLDTAYQGIDAANWKKLFASARQSHLEQFIVDMFAGKHINNSEDRPALHSALRNLSKTPVLINGTDVMPAVSEVWHRIEALCNKWVGVTDVIHIGIGGSDFGPRLAIEALAHVPGIESRGMRTRQEFFKSLKAILQSNREPHRRPNGVATAHPIPEGVDIVFFNTKGFCRGNIGSDSK